MFVGSRWRPWTPVSPGRVPENEITVSLALGIVHLFQTKLMVSQSGSVLPLLLRDVGGGFLPESVRQTAGRAFGSQSDGAVPCHWRPERGSRLQLSQWERPLPFSPQCSQIISRQGTLHALWPRAQARWQSGQKWGSPRKPRGKQKRPGKGLPRAPPTSCAQRVIVLSIHLLVSSFVP